MRFSDWSSYVCSSDLAQPGGCRHRPSHISAMAAPAAIPAAISGVPTTWPMKIPTAADRSLPPITGQGCASGLAARKRVESGKSAYVSVELDRLLTIEEKTHTKVCQH